MSDRDLTRRRVLLGTVALGATGLAGCTGGDPGGGGDAVGGGGPPTATATSTATHTPTGTATPTETADPTPTSGWASGFCEPLTGSPTPFDVSETPYVYQFDYVDSWRVGEPIEQSNARYERLESPVLTSDEGESSATIRVGQSLEGITAAEADEAYQAQLDREESSGVAYEDEFGGETVRFVEFPNVDVNSYVAYLPYGDGKDRYYGFSLVTFIEGGGPGQNVSECTDAVNVATQTVRGSLTVNPDSTIGGS